MQVLVKRSEEGARTCLSNNKLSGDTCAVGSQAHLKWPGLAMVAKHSCASACGAGYGTQVPGPHSRGPDYKVLRWVVSLTPPVTGSHLLCVCVAVKKSWLCYLVTMRSYTSGLTTLSLKSFNSGMGVGNSYK